MRLASLAALAAALLLAPTNAFAAPCAPGSFSDDGQDPCSPCDAGTYAASAGATSCRDCARHTISGPGASACVACGPDAYQPAAGSSTCLWRNRTSCWSVRDLENPAEFIPMEDVAASDEISDVPASLLRPELFCSPALIGSLPYPNPDPAMCCYKANGVKAETPAALETTGLIGGTVQLGIVKRALVCDQCQGPDTEQTVQCWKVRDLKNPKFDSLESLRIADEYSYDFPIVKKPALFCSPVALGGAPVLDPNAQTCCYQIGKAYRSGITESVTDPSGAPLELAITKRSLLCEPCEATLLP